MFVEFVRVREHHSCPHSLKEKPTHKKSRRGRFRCSAQLNHRKNGASRPSWRTKQRRNGTLFNPLICTRHKMDFNKFGEQKGVRLCHFNRFRKGRCGTSMKVMASWTPWRTFTLRVVLAIFLLSRREMRCIFNHCILNKMDHS